MPPGPATQILAVGPRAATGTINVHQPGRTVRNIGERSVSGSRAPLPTKSAAGEWRLCTSAGSVHVATDGDQS